MDSVKREKANLSSLRQHTAAWLLGIAPSQLSISDAPRNRDKSYNAKELVEWYVRHLTKHVPTSEDDPMLGASIDSPSLERMRARRADLLELDLAERRKELHPRQVVREVLARIAARFRRTAEAITRRYGTEAGLTIREALIESQHDLDETIGGNGHFHSDDGPTDAP